MANTLYPCLWFDGQAKEAAEHYCSIFKNSKIMIETPMVVTFELNNKRFMALNGGPAYSFSPATSFVVECETQEEIDYYWSRLGDGGKERECGWLDDKFGMSWQIIPTVLSQLMSDEKKANRVMKVVQKTIKFNIQELLDA